MPPLSLKAYLFYFTKGQMGFSVINWFLPLISWSPPFFTEFRNIYEDLPDWISAMFPENVTANINSLNTKYATFLAQHLVNTNRSKIAGNKISDK